MTSIFHHPYCKPFIRHPFESIKYFFISLKWAYQRVKKGYCDRDLIYGVENWLIEMLPDVIDEIQKEKCGVPGIIHLETIESFGINPDEYWDRYNNDLYKTFGKQIDAEAKKRWQDILTQISFLLRESVEEQCSKKNSFEEKCSETQPSDPKYEELWKCYCDDENKLEEYRERCKKEAAELFLKWSSYLEI